MIMSTLQQLAFEHIIWPIISAAIVALLGWISARWQQYTGQKIDQKHQESWRQGLENAIRQALQKKIQSGELAPNAKFVPSEIVDDVLNDGAIYMQNKMPETVDALGASFNTIKEALVARLPLPFDLNK